MLTIFTLAWLGDTSADKFIKMMHQTENDISAVSPGGIVPGLFLQVEQKAGEIAITKKTSNFRCSLLCGKGGIMTQF